MNQGKFIFAQLTDFLPRRVFDRIVDKYDGNKYVRSFSCWNQMLCMVFGCKAGFMHTVELLPKIRAPANVLYGARMLSC